MQYCIMCKHRFVQSSSVLAVCPGCATGFVGKSRRYSFKVTVQGTTTLSWEDKNLPHYRCTGAHVVEKLFQSFTMLDYLSETYLKPSEIAKIGKSALSSDVQTLHECIGRSDFPFHGASCKRVAFSSFWIFYQEDAGDIFTLSVKDGSGKWKKLSHLHLMLPDILDVNQEHFELQLEMFPIKPTQAAAPLTAIAPPVIVAAPESDEDFTDSAWMLKHTGMRAMPTGTPVPTLDGNGIVFACLYRKSDKTIPEGASRIFNSSKILNVRGKCYYLVVHPTHVQSDLPYGAVENFFRELYFIWSRQGAERADRLRLLVQPWTSTTINSKANMIFDEKDISLTQFLKAETLSSELVDKAAWERVCLQLGFDKPSAKKTIKAKKQVSSETKPKLLLKGGNFNMQDYPSTSKFSVEKVAKDTALRLYIDDEPSCFGVMFNATETAAELKVLIGRHLPGFVMVSRYLALHGLYHFKNWNAVLKLCAVSYNPSKVTTISQGDSISVNLANKETIKVAKMDALVLENYCRGRPISELIHEPMCKAYWNLWHRCGGDLQQMELATRVKKVAAAAAAVKEYGMEQRSAVLEKIAQLSQDDLPKIVQLFSEYSPPGTIPSDPAHVEEIEFDMNALSNEAMSKLEALIDELLLPVVVVARPGTPPLRKRPVILNCQELLPLANAIEANTERAIQELNDQVQRINGRVIDRDHQVAPGTGDDDGQWKQYSLDRQVLTEKICQDLNLDDDDDDSDTVSSEEGEVPPVLSEAEQREAKRAELKRQREQERAEVDLTPQAFIMEKARKQIELTLPEHMNNGVRFVEDTDGSLKVLHKLTNHEISSVQSTQGSQKAEIDMLREINTYTWGELVYNPTLFWNLARWADCKLSKMRSVCIEFDCIGPVKFFDHDGGVSLGISQGGRQRCVAAMNMKDSQQVGELLKHCASRTLEQLMNEPGSVNFWLLMHYCHLHKMSVRNVVVYPQEPAVQRNVLRSTRIFAETTEVTVALSFPLLEPGQFINTNLCDEVTAFLHSQYETQPQPNVVSYNSHFFDWVSRNGYTGIPQGKDLLVFVLHEYEHFYTCVYNVRANRFFIFDSVPRPTQHYETVAVQLLSILKVGGPANIQMVTGPVQRPGSNDCGFFAMVAEFLLSTQSFNDLVAMDTITWSMSVTPAWWTADQISGLRAELCQHLLKTKVPSTHQEDEVNSEGKRTMVAMVTEPGEKRVRFEDQDDQ